MQHVLILGKVWPEPGSSAAGSRTMQLIEVFREQGYRISFACAAGESEFSPDLESIGIEKFSVKINDSSFDELIKELNPNLVIFDRFTTEEQFGWRLSLHCPEAIKILDTIDLHCLRQARHQAVKENREFTNADFLASEVAKREVASIYRCDLSLMVSETEIDILKAVFNVPPALLYYLPLFYDELTQQQLDQWKLFNERKHFISIGNFLHEPNWDSVVYLKKTIWPLIRKELPKTELHIYGAYATQKVFELNNTKEGFIIKGRAKSAFEVMEEARVCLAPLRFGAGIKGKLLDSMLCGTPGVTTRIGSESMHGSLPWNGAIADAPEDFARSAVTLYNTEEVWKSAQLNGIAIINSVFSKKTHAARFLSALRETSLNLNKHRQANFTGAMLQQQANAATKYMALWIEEKNKKSLP